MTNAVNLASAAGTGFFRNKLINGAMQFWQRSTSNTAITNGPAYVADRWYGFVAATVTEEQIVQSTDVPAGFPYSAKWGRPSGTTNAYSVWFCQHIESVNMLDMVGQYVTLSFWAKKGANYSGGNLTARVATGTAADQSSGAFSGGPATGYTGNVAVLDTTQALTTTWTRYTFTSSAVVPSNALEMAVAFGFTPTGTAGADDNIYITGIQLETGTVATPFERRSYGMELALCQRYYEKSYDIATTPGSITVQGAHGVVSINAADTYDYGRVRFVTLKRTTPTITLYNPNNGATVQSRGYSTATDRNAYSRVPSFAGFELYSNNWATNDGIRVHFTADAEL